MRIDPRDTRNTASYWQQGMANGHLFTHCLVSICQPCCQSDAVFLVSRGSIRIWYIFRLTFRSLSDVSYSDECRTKKVLLVCEKNISAISWNSGILQYQQIIHIVDDISEQLQMLHQTILIW